MGVLYVMHALFPKDSNYQDSPFLKVGEKSCLQFKNNKSIDTPYALYWRGADASIIGKNYFVESGSASILKVPFDFEKKHLTWVNGQIPEFFWQVYNNDEAIDFSEYSTVLSSDAVTVERWLKDPGYFTNPVIGGVLYSQILLILIGLLTTVPAAQSIYNTLTLIYSILDHSMTLIFYAWGINANCHWLL